MGSSAASIAGEISRDEKGKTREMSLVGEESRGKKVKGPRRSEDGIRKIPKIRRKKPAKGSGFALGNGTFASPASVAELHIVFPGGEEDGKR